MATWGTIEAEVQKLLDDESFETTGENYSYLLTWGNRLQKEIASLIVILDHITDGNVSADTTDYYKSMPSDFLKVINGYTAVKVDDVYIDIVNLDYLHYLDPDHDETTDASEPSFVAIVNNNIYYYPKCDCILTIESYQKKPTDMTDTSSTVDLPDHPILEELMIAGVARKGFEWLGENILEEKQNRKFQEYFKEYRKFINNQYSRSNFVDSTYEVS